jgi:CAAX prenyl protease-like protein
MEFLREKYKASPEFPRIAPFGAYAAVSFLQGQFGPDAAYIIYLLKTLAGAWLVWEARSFVAEMRWKISWEGILVGVAIFAVWVGLDGHYPRLSKVEAGWNPNTQYGEGSAMAWFFVVVRTAGSSLIVPPAEEIFYRSFLYRYLVKIDFLKMPLGQFHALSFFVTSILFGLMHPDRWLAGILCGLAYQGLVVRKDRLGDAITAHAVTNFLLSLWVVWKQAWNFW